MFGSHGHEKRRYALLSIFSNSSLVMLKLAAGFFTGSIAIISEALHSALDLLAALMAYCAVRIADKPPDPEHPFGHGKAENLAALFEALLILAAAGFIIREAVLGLMHPAPLPGVGLGAAVMLVSAVINWLVSGALFRAGHRTRSDALTADAWHLRTDVYTSLGVFLGLGLVTVGSRLKPDWNLHFIDPLCALLVAALIIKAGCVLAWAAVENLIDQSLSAEEIATIEEHIRELSPGIKGWSGLKTRRSGPFRQVEVNLEVDGNLSVWEAHALGERVVESIRYHFPDADIIFHLEPK